MKSFEIQWTALTEKKKESDPETPKLTKALTAMKWAESFSDVMHRCIGSRTIPLSYVIRKDAAPEPVIAPVIAPAKPHAAEFDSIEEELTARASHTHPLFRDDNSALYFKLEEALRGTQFHPTIMKFQRTKNGRMAYFAVVNAHAGDDKWNAEIAKSEDLLHNYEWKGENNFTLEKHIQNHRNAAITLEAAAEHVTYQVPNEYTLVGYLLNSIKCRDPELQAAMAGIKADKDLDGKRYKMDRAIEELQPADPVMRKRKETKRARFADVSDATIADATSIKAPPSKMRTGIGKTGVHLRYYETADYNKLNADQKNELRAWRSTPEGKAALANDKSAPGRRRDGKRQHHNTRASIESVIDERFNARLKAIEDEREKDRHVNVLLAALEQQTPKRQAIVGSASELPNSNAMNNAKEYLKSILNKSKN